MNLIFLSPHLDDAVLSCGAILYDLIHKQHHNVEVWTLFSGDVPPGPLSSFAAELHQRWNTGLEAPKARRAEDKLACERLGVEPRYLMLPDCIYRFRQGTNLPLIEKNEDLFNLPLETESSLIQELSLKLANTLPAECRLVLPLGVGGHIDHLLTRAVGETINKSPYYFADFPYSGSHPEEIAQKLPVGAECMAYPLSNQSLAAWQYAVEAYTSQISSFWPSLSQMYQAVQTYATSPQGNCLWKID
jgi:LmbE family N-acetylglucosaminyl deacetylase